MIICTRRARVARRPFVLAEFRRMAFISVILFALPRPADAQQPVPAETVCLVNKQKAGKVKVQPFTIAVRSSLSGKYIKRGFSIEKCPDIKKQNDDDRSRMCDMAMNVNKSLYLAFWQRFQVTPAEMCREIISTDGI